MVYDALDEWEEALAGAIVFEEAFESKADITFKQVSNLQKYKQGQESVNGLTRILGEEGNNEINRDRS